MSNLGWAAHATHHSSNDYNFSTALRQSVGEGMVRAGGVVRESWSAFLGHQLHPGAAMRAAAIVGSNVDSSVGSIGRDTHRRGSPASAPRASASHCLQYSWVYYLYLAPFAPLEIFALHKGINTVIQASAAGGGWCRRDWHGRGRGSSAAVRPRPAPGPRLGTRAFTTGSCKLNASSTAPL